MHIADKGRLFAEIVRVLRPGGRLALQDILAGAAQPAHYPTPWAATAGESFLPTEKDLRDALATAGLREVARQAVAVSPAWRRTGAPLAPRASNLGRRGEPDD